MDIDLTHGRERPVNYITICDTIADSYPKGVAHGIQKDAIQNSFDARRGGNTVEIEFHIVENAAGRFLTITDKNTFGLTGPVVTDLEVYSDGLPRDYHWARFESFGFTKDDPDAIGARGQGKFIFMKGSGDYTIYYDSLREDGVYRLGATRAQKTSCPILPATHETPWENGRAVNILAQQCGLDPLCSIGTRIIIKDPIEELLESIRMGEFERAIQETWFRVIEKKLLLVRISDSDQEKDLSLPSPFPLPNDDSKAVKTWILGKDFQDKLIGLQGGAKYSVKNFHVLYLNEGSIEEDMRGVTILHNGMKITSLEMTVAPTEVRKRVVGYIEFDRELERELRKGINQHPNHYDLRWRRQIPQAVKHYITARLDEFGKTKLGLGVDPREAKRRRRHNAEEWAMRRLQRFGRDLDLFGSKGKRLPRPDIPPPPAKEIGVTINHFSFPDPKIAPRVNWGQAFEQLGVTTWNRTNENFSVATSLVVLHGDRIYQTLIDRERAELSAHSDRQFGQFEIRVDQTSFAEPGEYRIKASIFDLRSGDQLDAVSRRFWVESDPPLRQPFNVEYVPGFPEPNHRRQWLATGGVNESPTLYINTDHPAYRSAENDEDELAELQLEILLEGALQFVLRRPDDKDGTPDYHPLDRASILGDNAPIEREAVPDRTFQEIARYLSEIRWRRFE